jgi:hypothetical protein
MGGVGVGVDVGVSSIIVGVTLPGSIVGNVSTNNTVATITTITTTTTTTTTTTATTATTATTVTTTTARNRTRWTESNAAITAPP